MIADCLLKRNDTTVVTYVSKFRPHLLGKQFTLRTDHGALLAAQGKLQEFDYTIVHRSSQ